MNLELFLTTMNEYKRFSTELPFESAKALSDSYSKSTYVAIQTRLMLLRKYISQNKSNNIYLENLINEAIKQFPNDKTYLNDLQRRFVQTNARSYKQILSDGTELNLYQTIEDTMYGLYLHADCKRVTRLSYTKEGLRFLCTRKYVEDIESLIFEFDKYLRENGVTAIVEASHERAPVVQLGVTNKEKQGIILSPYWSNLHGQDGTTEDVKASLRNYSSEDLQILLFSLVFFDELKKDNVSMETMKKIVFSQNYHEWGNFQSAIAFYKSISNPGIDNRVRYNEQKDAAYVYILPNVEDVFIISSPHIVSDVYAITFVKDAKDDLWKIFAFGGKIDPYIRE